MTQITEAIYANGVLRPVEQLDIPDQQRVRIIIQPINSHSLVNRADALERLRRGIEQMSFFSQGHLPSRDELHDRT